MGFRAYEHRPLAYHLATPVSASEMRRGWVAMARCQACQLDLRIDLDLPLSASGMLRADGLHGHPAGAAGVRTFACGGFIVRGGDASRRGRPGLRRWLP